METVRALMSSKVHPVLYGKQGFAYPSSRRGHRGAWAGAGEAGGSHRPPRPGNLGSSRERGWSLCSFMNV